MTISFNLIEKTTCTDNFTIFPNQTCQIRFKGDTLPSAKEVYHYLLSLPANWVIKIRNVAKHFGTTVKYMQKLFRILMQNDVMIGIPDRLKSGRFAGMIYQVFQPKKNLTQPAGRLKSVPDDKCLKSKEETRKPPEDAKSLPDTYYNKKIKRAADPPPKPSEKPAAADSLLSPKIEARLRENPGISRQWIVDGIQNLGLNEKYILKAFEISQKKNNPIGYFRCAMRTEYQSLDDGLKTVEMPKDAKPQQKSCIKCYNANVEKETPTCPTIKPNEKSVRHKPSELCALFCPFVLANKELFKIQNQIRN